MIEPSSHIENVSARFQSLNIIALLVLLLAAAAFAVWYYRSTVPPVSGIIRRLLIILRASALVLLVAGLSEPVVRVARTLTRESGCAVLLDTSSSMNQPGDPARKRDALDAINAIRSRFDEHCIYRTFDSGVRNLDETVEFNGSATDISGAIKTIRDRERVSSIVLITDGRWNLGLDPAGADVPSDMPVSCVAVGSGAGLRDVVLKRVSAASIGYDGMSIPVEIFVSSTNPLSGQVAVEIREGEKNLASGTVSFDTGTLAKTDIELPLKTPGVHTFTAVIKPDYEEPPENNSRSFTVQVVKSAFRVLVISDAPSPDLAFLRRVIEADKSFSGVFVVGHGMKEPLSAPFPADISDFDAFVILDGGGEVLTPERAAAIAGLAGKGAGLWILGSTPLSNGAEALERIFPVRFAKDKNILPHEFYIDLTEQGRTHFVTAGVLSGDRENEWSNLPPLRAILPIDQITKSSRILVNAVAVQGKVTLPALVAGKSGEGKTMIMPVSGIWRWHLMMEGAGKSGGFYDGFVRGMLRWLTSSTDASPLTVTTDSHTYLSGQEIVFEGRLFDNVYSPVPGAEISIEIDGDPSAKVILDERTPAVYTGTLRGSAPGAHVFEATAFIGGERFAEARGGFTVQSFSLEMLDPNPDHGLLGSLARRTGGLSVTPSGIDSVIAGIKPAAFTERREQDHYLALNPLMPLLAVLFLVVEWGIRKYRGMI
ncbi:hypothetical protein LLG96_13915 [bacterium]|nr:hypothetical protein [bacterium]